MKNTSKKHFSLTVNFCILSVLAFLTFFGCQIGNDNGNDRSAISVDQIINNHTAVKDNQIILDDECYMDLLKAGLSSSQIDGLKDHLNKTNKQLREGEVTMGDLYREVPYFNSDDSDSRAILPCATTTGETKTVFAWFYIDFYMNSCDTQEFKYGLGAGVAIIAAAVTGGWGALLGYLPVATIDLMASKGNGGIIIRWFYWAGTWIILPQY